MFVGEVKKKQSASEDVRAAKPLVEGEQFNYQVSCVSTINGMSVTWRHQFLCLVFNNEWFLQSKCIQCILNQYPKSM